MRARRARGRNPSPAEQLARDFRSVPELGGDRLEPDPIPGRLWDRALLGPLRDFLARPSKRFRARVTEAAWALAGGAPGGPPPALPLVIEMLHAGSLIIDDIEDGSHSRRGGEALHVRFGLPIALNAGNWLYFWSHLHLARLPLPAPARLRLYELAAVSLLRCHQGQALDISVRVFDLGCAEVRGVVGAVSRLKTGGLLELAAACGAAAAGADSEVVELLRDRGRDLAVGLQMLDDLSGLVRPARRAKADEDLRLARPTWPWVWLAESCDSYDYAMALAELRRVHRGADPTRLCELLRARVALRGLGAARAQMARTMDRLALAFGDVPALASIRREVTALEGEYVGG